MFKTQFLERFFSTSKDKKGVSCEHQINQNDNINGNTNKCMQQLKQKFQHCQHEVKYYCFEKDKLSDKCPFICDKLLPNGDICKKKCYENCLHYIDNGLLQIDNGLCQIDNGQELNNNNLCEHFLQSKDICQEQQKQCNQEVKVLLDCDHEAIFKCCQRQELQKSYNCKQICKKIRSCGHSSNKCLNYCFQQQCSPCIQKITKKLNCDHEIQIYCYQNDDIIQSNTPCNECQNKKQQSKNLTNQKQSFKNQITVRLQCGHTLQTTQDQKESILQSFKCQEKCTKKRLCQHDQACDNLCYQECTPCREIIEEVLPCGHIAKLQCFNAKQELQNYKCNQPCNKQRPCHHLDPCLEKCGDHICTPCQKIVNKQFKCAHNILSICSNLSNYQCKEMCTRPQQCQHPCLKYCWEDCGPCEQKIQKDFVSCSHKIEIACFEKQSQMNQKCEQCAQNRNCLVQ